VPLKPINYDTKQKRHPPVACKAIRGTQAADQILPIRLGPPDQPFG